MADKDQDQFNDVDNNGNREYDEEEKVDYDYNEETAAEPVVDERLFAEESDDKSSAGTGIGWLAIVLSAIGLVFLPVVMGAAGIIVGIIARKQGAHALGAWAIGIGVVAIVIALFTGFF